MFALLALLKLLSLLFLSAIHLIHLLLLAALELVLALLICVLAAQSLLFLIIAPLHFLVFGVLLALHLVELLFVPLLQLRIGGRIGGVTRGRRAIKFAASIRITRVRTVSVVASSTVIGSAVLDVTAMKIAGARSRRDFGTAMVDGGAEVTISASAFKMMVLL